MTFYSMCLIIAATPFRKCRVEKIRISPVRGLRRANSRCFHWDWSFECDSAAGLGCARKSLKFKDGGKLTECTV